MSKCKNLDRIKNIWIASMKKISDGYSALLPLFPYPYYTMHSMNEPDNKDADGELNMDRISVVPSCCSRQRFRKGSLFRHCCKLWKDVLVKTHAKPRYTHNYPPIIISTPQQPHVQQRFLLLFQMPLSHTHTFLTSPVFEERKPSSHVRHENEVAQLALFSLTACYPMLSPTWRRSAYVRKNFHLATKRCDRYVRDSGTWNERNPST